MNRSWKPRTAERSVSPQIRADVGALNILTPEQRGMADGLTEEADADGAPGEAGPGHRLRRR